MPLRYERMPYHIPVTTRVEITGAGARKKEEEEYLRTLRSKARLAGMDELGRPSRERGGRGMVAVTYDPSGRRLRTERAGLGYIESKGAQRRRMIGRYETALGKHDVAEEKRKDEEAEYTSWRKEQMKEFRKEEKIEKKEDDLVRYIQSRATPEEFGKTYYDKYNRPYKLDDAEDATEILRQESGKDPSERIKRLIRAIKWPAGGKSELRGQAPAGMQITGYDAKGKPKYGRVKEKESTELRQLEREARNKLIALPEGYYKMTSARKIEFLKEHIPSQRRQRLAKEAKEETRAKLGVDIGIKYDRDRTMFAFDKVKAGGQEALDELHKRKTYWRSRGVDTDWIMRKIEIGLTNK